MISIDVLFLIGLIFFIKMPLEKRSEKIFWIPFLILLLTVFYENFGAYLTQNSNLNESINIFLGNDINLSYNVWLFNIANTQICTILILLLLSLYLPKKLKKIVRSFILLFISFCVVAQASGFQLIYDSQPILFAVGAGFILISCGFYFLSFMNEDIYLEIDPLRLFSFWQAIFILFYFSLTFLKTISEKYLWEQKMSLAISLGYINTILWIFIMVTLVLTIVSRSLNWKFENQPSHV